MDGRESENPGPQGARTKCATGGATPLGAKKRKTRPTGRVAFFNWPLGESNRASEHILDSPGTDANQQSIDAVDETTSHDLEVCFSKRLLDLIQKVHPVITPAASDLLINSVSSNWSHNNE